MHVRVAVRVRPLLDHEKGAHASTLLRHDGESVGVVGRNGALVNFAVDHVSVGAIAQETFFDASGMEPLVNACVDGYHGTVFAYGQTGSGKTYTMEGYEYSPSKPGRAPEPRVESTHPMRLGVVPRAVQMLYAKVGAKNREIGEGAGTLRVLVSFVQVYKEQVLDLLNPSLPDGPGAARRPKHAASSSRTHTHLTN